MSTPSSEAEGCTWTLLPQHSSSRESSGWRYIIQKQCEAIKPHIVNEQPADITLSTGVEARLDLTDDQLSMIKALNDVGFQNRLVLIKKTIFSHSAIIVRRDSEMFSEGRVVIDHWLEHDFDM